MIKKSANKTSKLLLERIQAHGHGVVLQDLAFYFPAISRRTLQRHLAQLIAQGSLKRIKRRYHYALLNEERTIDNTIGIPLSNTAKEIQSLIQQPLNMRYPVGYHREFLDHYKPNETFYLSRAEQDHLHTIGQPIEPAYAAGTYVKKIFHRLLVDISWNSSRLEGNTYSLLETERLFQEQESAEGKPMLETQMLLNHKRAIEFLVTEADTIQFNRYTLCNLHALLGHNLLPTSAACGRLRSIPVNIKGTIYHPLEIPALIEECFQKILDKAEAIQNPYEQAFFVMVHLPYLQAFDDINKRVSRFAANIPFIKNNLSPLSFIDVPLKIYIDGLFGIYELNRIELLRDLFIWSYERSARHYAALRQSIIEPDPIRLRYQQTFSEVLSWIIRHRANSYQAQHRINEHAHRAIPEQDRLRWIELVQRELLELHEGNIARYHLSLNDFRAWRENWMKAKK